MKKTLNLLLVLLIIAAIGIIIYFLRAQNASVISGDVDLNGSIPEQSNVVIRVKEAKNTEFETVINGLSAQDKTVWVWKGAKEGVVYDIQAVLVVDGKPQQTSQTLTVAAPSIRNTLTINSLQPGQGKATIAGGIDLNGPVTQTSTITLLAKKLTDSTYQTITTQVPAVDGAQWSWADASKGTVYQLKAVLYVNGVYSGESSPITVAAPAYYEMLRINSQYNPPATSATVSGTVNINGPVPTGSTINITAQTAGSSQVNTVATGVPAANGVQWSWTSAVSGGDYQMQALLFQNGQQVAQSSTLAITAPAANETFTININTNLTQPVNSPTASCVNQSGNSWTVNINYQTIPGAQQYWLQVGSQPNSNNVVNYQSQPTNANYQVYVLSNVNNNQPYFATYSYSQCSNCTGTGSFAPFSNSLQFSCNTPSATPTPTPQPQPTASPTPTSAPATPTPSPTLNPTATPIPPTNSPQLVH